jgi:LacI family transcriptional regulator
MKQEPRVTIADLVKATGFSAGTISRAFNPSKEIREETKKIIIETAERIGYRPHSGARTIKTGRTKRWGVLLPDLSNPCYSELIEYLELEAARRDSGLLLGLSRYDANQLDEMLIHWAAGETDGVIIDPVDPEQNHQTFQQLSDRGFPMVFLYAEPFVGSEVVCSDMNPGFEEMTQRLLALGHRVIGYVGTDLLPLKYNSGYMAVKRTLAKHGLKIDSRHIRLGGISAEGGEAAWGYFRSLPNPPTAFICFNDVIALGFMRVAREEGRRIPEDFSVAGFDDIHEALHAGLTTIRGNLEEMARQVFVALEAQLTGDPRKPEIRRIGTEVVFRESVGVPPCGRAKR